MKIRLNFSKFSSRRYSILYFFVSSSFQEFRLILVFFFSPFYIFSPLHLSFSSNFLIFPSSWSHFNTRLKNIYNADQKKSLNFPYASKFRNFNWCESSWKNFLEFDSDFKLSTGKRVSRHRSGLANDFCDSIASRTIPFLFPFLFFLFFEKNNRQSRM